MHDIDEINVPINILNFFSRTSNSHHYFTPSSTSQHFYIKKNLDLMHLFQKRLSDGTANSNWVLNIDG